MTSRPPLGVQQRPPQHKLSGPALSQRPAAHQRAVSQQQYPPPAPGRKDASFYDSSPADSSDGAPARPGVPRRGGSRLKLELSHDSAGSLAYAGADESPSAVGSSKALTPSRVMPATDSSDLGDMSPHLSTHPQSADPDTPLPMPRRRPPSIANASRREMPPPPASSNSTKREARPKPFSVEPPAAAPRYPTHAGAQTRAGRLAPPPLSGYADFFPWTGKHPEDQFSENVIRNGYYDKSLFSTTETQSAKGILFPALKHKTGLTALSSVFTAVLGQRRHNGQITAPPTFKPPPRVTLTDTKREVWLRDLANPAISLRRLSRTIPHGVRGKVLLEQCLDKHVPTDRAVWLIKCVGANEIRATKRKGVSTLVMGGETRWIKDWTVSVEQFIEHVYFSFDEDDWKAKVHYTTRLAAHLYAEHLLDREHYSEWLVSSLENTSEARLPMWMLITQLYWKDLLKLRKYGRRLVAALISHHHLIYNHPDRDILHPLLQNLSQCLNTLILSTPENFVSPSTWSKYRDGLNACLPPGNDALLSSFAAINLRNEQLATAANRSQPATRHILVRALDGTLQTPMPAELPFQCWGISKDKAALARALLEWCTSLYRPGLAKIYVTSRIMQHWSTLGLDATMALLDFLNTDTCEQRARKASLYHVVCELARSGIFSVPRYVQWLILRGGVRNPEDVLPDGPGPTRLLAEIPQHALGASQRNLRSGLLRRASFSVVGEAQDVELAITHLKRTLGMPMDPADTMLPRKPLSVNKLCQRIRSASRALKAEVGCWLRATFAAHAEEKERAGNQAPDISPAIFYAVRSVLEAAEDFAMLSDILKTLTKHSGVEVLAAIADTVSRHFFVFSALGDSGPLFRNLHQRLKSAVREQGVAVRPLLASLVTLAPRIPGMEELASQLKRDLVLSDRQNPVDACSPVSDNMVARLQDNAGELHEEIEKLLAGGSSLDRNTMDRLFQTVTQRLQASWGKADDNQRAYSSLLGRLRVFDMQHFDGLMARWLLYLRTLSSRPSILRIYPLLVSVGCLDMSSILATASESPAGQGAGITRIPTAGTSTPQVVQITYRTRYMQEVLQLLTTPLLEDDLMTADEVYRFSIFQDQAIRGYPKEIVGLIILASAEYSYAKSQNDFEALPLESHLVLERLLDLLRRLVLRDAAGVARALSVRSPNPQVSGLIDVMITKLLMPTSDARIPINFDQVLELTNEFTLPFCQVKLALSLSSNEQNMQEAGDRQQSHVELFANAMDKAISAGNVSWVGMLSSLSTDVMQQLRLRAQNRFLELLPSVRSPPTADAARAQNLQMAENLLTVIDATMRGGPPGVARQTQLSPSIVDKLIDLWELLATPDDPDPALGEAIVAAKTTVLNSWLPLTLNLITLHVHSLDPSKATNDARAKMLVACAGLMQELDALQLPGSGMLAAMDAAQLLSRRLFDLSCLLVDNLPEDARAMCVRAVRECAAGDGRLRYIFSVGVASGDGDGSASGSLMLSHRDNKSAGAGAGASIPSGSGTNNARPTAAATPGAGVGNNNTLFSGLLGTPAALWGLDRGQGGERLSVFQYRRWETLSEPTPNVGENDTALSLALFEARRVK
ncbi:mediator of RNA polymerase II transcription subunit 12 [Achaetomium macrosporum]|uniref:Mediator of RNA polymerase II transcription subunit 12 n=1 Tax=Achaetomium macrosporum TaxID=79813 RepID=A0AAN7HDV1_9PEZI|nr:mediator of RNA polymerase II transcription subunit 12 [Achaetomium macrosporum]